eukprot:1178910-Rhodomonas_salina.1
MFSSPGRALHVPEKPCVSDVKDGNGRPMPQLSSGRHQGHHCHSQTNSSTFFDHGAKTASYNSPDSVFDVNKTPRSKAPAWPGNAIIKSVSTEKYVVLPDGSQVDVSVDTVLQKLGDHPCTHLASHECNSLPVTVDRQAIDTLCSLTRFCWREGLNTSAGGEGLFNLKDCTDLHGDGIRQTSPAPAPPTPTLKVPENCQRLFMVSPRQPLQTWDLWWGQNRWRGRKVRQEGCSRRERKLGHCAESAAAKRINEHARRQGLVKERVLTPCTRLCAS